jgi:signal transduction histidine kinase
VDDETAWVKSHLALPICLRDRVLGLLRLDSDVSGEFSAEDAQRLEPLASAAAIALENARLYEQVKRHAVELETRVAERTHELAEANERLQELDRLKSRFVSDVSHELRTPVANIKLYLHLLEHGKVEKRSDYLTVLREQSDRQSQLVEDILRLSRLELGKEKVEFVPVDLNAVVGQVFAALQPAAEAANLELTFEPDEDLPLVRAERNQLAQVVTNLVTNAIKYTPAGQVRINLCLDAERGQACLEVHDTGMGIDPQDLPHIFERFYRGQKVGGSTVPGTGLGLSIVKEIVDLHEGKIEVESQLGTGSTFRVWLPLRQGNK